MATRKAWVAGWHKARSHTITCRLATYAGSARPPKRARGDFTSLSPRNGTYKTGKDRKNSWERILVMRKIIRCIAIASFFIAAISLLSCEKSRVVSYGLGAEDIIVSHTKDGKQARPLVFKPGDPIYIRFNLAGFALDPEGKIWIQEDLAMIDAEKNFVLINPNIIDEHVAPLEGNKPLPVNNTISLFENAAPGTYKIQINVRDKIGGGSVFIESNIVIEGSK